MAWDWLGVSRGRGYSDGASRRDASVGADVYIYCSECYRETSAGGSHLLHLTSLRQLPTSPGHVSTLS
jgi:hypothetical protein